MVEVYGICGDSDGIVKTCTVKNVLFGENVFADDAPGFTDTHEGGYPVNVGILKTGDKRFQVSDYLGVLFYCNPLALCVLSGVGGVYAVDTGHVDPPFIWCHAGHEDGSLDRKIISLLACFTNLVAEAYHCTVVIGAEKLVGNKVDVVYLRVVGYGIA